MDKSLLQNTPLGKKTNYESHYNPNFLYGVPRANARNELQIPNPRPFTGVDVWNSCEFSWLNMQGKPQIAIAEFQIPDSTKNIIESKTFKLYLNSFSQTPMVSNEALIETLKNDLSKVAEGEILVKLILPETFSDKKTQEFTGICLDKQDIAIQSYQLNTNFLTVESQRVTETVYSHLFRSTCPVTNQPDWASILIRYHGKKISHEGLLKYLISYREYNDFGEQCAEHIYMDILRRCEPEKLTVQMFFTRRGGLDINPFRSNFENLLPFRTFRQ